MLVKDKMARDSRVLGNDLKKKMTFVYQSYKQRMILKEFRLE